MLKEYNETYAKIMWLYTKLITGINSRSAEEEVQTNQNLKKIQKNINIQTVMDML